MVGGMPVALLYGMTRLTDLAGFFRVYVCAYYFIINKDIELNFFNERAGRKEKK